MRPGDPLKTIKPIRSQKTGSLLPREGTFVSAVENLGRKLILVNFGQCRKRISLSGRGPRGIQQRIAHQAPLIPSAAYTTRI